MNKKISLLILAAGSSSRLGEAKQLLSWKNTTLVEHVVSTARASLAKAVTLVMGANATKISSKINTDGISLVTNKAWALGLGSSIACGIKHIIANDIDTDAVLIVLADQPLIDTHYLNLLIATYTNRNCSIVGTKYKSGTGVPAVFGKRYFKELSELGHDYGARDIIRKYSDVTIVVDAKGKEKDIDTKADYIDLVDYASKEKL